MCQNTIHIWKYFEVSVGMALHNGKFYVGHVMSCVFIRKIAVGYLDVILLINGEGFFSTHKPNGILPFQSHVVFSRLSPRSPRVLTDRFLLSAGLIYLHRRGTGIRTLDLLVRNQALYQAEPYPELHSIECYEGIPKP